LVISWRDSIFTTNIVVQAKLETTNPSTEVI